MKFRGITRTCIFVSLIVYVTISTAPQVAQSFQFRIGLGSVAYAADASFTTSTPPVVTVVQPPKETILNQTIEQGIPVTDSPMNDWPMIQSQAAVVMDATTGTIIYEKNPLVRHYPASITKIMTAMIALQHGKLSDILTATEDSTSQPPDSLYMVPGEKATLQNVLYGLLLDSANDAAVMIADKYGGSVAGFAKMMNTGAVTLGAVHTHFVNPNGLPDDNHYSTAYDMALIARAAMQYPEFRKIVDTKTFHWTGEKWSANLTNLNTMLFYFPGSIGIKTGYTSVANETLVEAAKRGNQTFIAVLMDTPTDYEIRNDCSQLLDFAFQHYRTETVMRSGAQVSMWHTATGKTQNLVAGTSVLATVPLTTPISSTYKVNISSKAPSISEPKGMQVGEINWTNTSTKVSTPVVLSTSWVVPPKPKPELDGMLRWIVSGIVIVSLLAWMRRTKRG